MTTNELYRLYLKELKQIYSESEASNITRLIFESFGNISRADIIKTPETLIPQALELQLNESLQSLLQHKPVQYIIGEAWFYQLKFKVTNAVLIPRPETEELVDEVINFLKQSPNKKVLDIGTGSGCIPIAIKKNMPVANVTSIDISENAIAVAKENAERNDVEINFIQMDFLNDKEWNKLELYDVVVSNPPYIPELEKASIENNVKMYEPHNALFVPDMEPLIFYEAILNFCKIQLAETGKIFMETHENYANEVCQLFLNNGFSAEIKKDLNDKQRMVMATHYR